VRTEYVALAAGAGVATGLDDAVPDDAEPDEAAPGVAAREEGEVVDVQAGKATRAERTRRRGA
jgi:hypothetical protein